MSGPPFDPSARIDAERLTWRRVLASYAMLAAFPLLLWAASDPLAAGLAVAGSAVAVVATTHARRLARCVEQCRGVALDLPGTVDVAVTWGTGCDAC